MTITKTVLAAAFLAVMAVSAQAQQGPTRQIQVLPAPGKQAAAPVVADQAPINVEGQAPAVEAPAAEVAPAPEAAPQVAPKLVAPKVLAVAPKFVDAKPEPKFVEPKFVEPKFVPVKKASYGHGYGKRHCH